MDEGYIILEVNEHNTSKMCYCCEHALEFARCCDQLTGRAVSNIRLMRCCNKKCKFDSINRDSNAAKNMARIGYEVLFKNKRPEYLQRAKKDE